MKLKLQVHFQKVVILGTELSGPYKKDQNFLIEETLRSLKLYVLPLKEFIPLMLPERRRRSCNWPQKHLLPLLCPGQPSPRLPCLVQLMNVERKHSRLRERTHTVVSPLCSASCPFLCGQGRRFYAILQSNQNYARRVSRISLHYPHYYCFLRALTFPLHVQQSVRYEYPQNAFRKVLQKARGRVKAVQSWPIIYCVVKHFGLITWVFCTNWKEGIMGILWCSV